jgi:hypothetical protein
MVMRALPILSRIQTWLRARRESRRWQITSGAVILLVALLVAGLLIWRQQQLAAQARVTAATCATSASATANNLVMLPPGVTLPIKIPAGEPRIVATVNGAPLCAMALELRVEGILANHRQMLQQIQHQPYGMPPIALPPNILASLKETPNQVRHDALTQMIQEQLLWQQGKRLGLTASRAVAQAMARQTIQTFYKIPASSPGYASFAAYLRENHLNEQTFPNDPRVLQGYEIELTIVAMRQHILKGLPSGEPPTAGINAYIQHLWHTQDVRVYLPAQLGW